MQPILRRTSPLLATFPLLGATSPEQAQAQPIIPAIDGTGTVVASHSNSLDIPSSTTTAVPTLPETFTPEYSKPDSTGVTQGTEMLLAQAITSAPDGTGTNVTSEGNQFNIKGGTQSGANLFHSFQQFGLEKNQIANFLSNPSIKNILGRVVGGDASMIDGLIRVKNGNSNLFLMNPAGIIFGSNARLDIPGSFMATTANGIQIDDDWFKAVGTNTYANLGGIPNGFAFTTDQPGSIVNAGNLTVLQGETITLVGGTVVNTGTFCAPGGKITIAAVPGEKLVRISQEGSLLSLELPVETKAVIDGNSQPLTPQSLPQLLAGNADRVTGVAVENGVVKLTGSGIAIPSEPGTAIAAGTLDVSNPVAGESGGTVDVLGERVGLFEANINASGMDGGGRVRIGGDYKGEGTVPNASRTFVSSDSVINANALTSGDGGRVIVWADKTTGFYGNISARGGSNAGNGGFVEVSGKENLIFRGNVDVSAYNGSFGTLLLDPENIIIVDGDANSGANDAELADGSILYTDPGTTFTIFKGTLESLTGDVQLEASNNITIANGVSLNFVSSFNAGSITFKANADGVDGGSFRMMDQTQSITANGRDLTISGANITAGDITGRSVILFANENINAGIITATENVSLTTMQGDITVDSIKISLPQTFNNSDSNNPVLKVNAARLFRVTGTVDKNGKDSIIIEDKTEDNSLMSVQQIISITHGGKEVNLDGSQKIDNGNPTLAPPLTIKSNGGGGSFGFVVGPKNENLLVSGSNDFPEGISGTSGRIIFTEFIPITINSGSGTMQMFQGNTRTFNGSDIGTPINVSNNGGGNAVSNGGGNGGGGNTSSNVDGNTVSNSSGNSGGGNISSNVGSNAVDNSGGNGGGGNASSNVGSNAVDNGGSNVVGNAVSSDGGSNVSVNPGGDFLDSFLTINLEENTSEKLKCKPSNTNGIGDSCKFDEDDEDEILRYED